MPPEDPRRSPLDASALTRAVGRSRWRLEVVAQSPSTNAEVAARARAREPAGLVLVADHQTSGRGRLDRSWLTPPGAALTFSVLVAPDEVPVSRWPWLPLLTGLAVVDGIRTATGLPASLKWPNDVLLDVGTEQAKTAGILVERVEVAGRATAVVGVGLNVSADRDELPVPTATSLALAGAVDLDRGALLVAVLAGFARRYDDWCAAGGGGVRDGYVAACSTLGRPVRVELPRGDPLVGRAVGLDEDGRLLVEDGRRTHRLGAGDVVHVRPSPGGAGDRMPAW